MATVIGAERPLSMRLIRRGLKIGRARSLKDDPAYALRLLVDVGIRALSPAVNDPTTAVAVLDQIEQLLISLGRSRFDESHLRDAAGAVRVVCARAPHWEDVLALALIEIQQYGRDAYQVERRLGALLPRLLEELPAARHPAVAAFLRQHRATLDQAFSRADDRDEAAAPDPQGLGHTHTALPS
jgi:uncharacterized membrane protein